MPFDEGFMVRYPQGRTCVFPLCGTQVTCRIVPPYPGSEPQVMRRIQEQHTMEGNSLLRGIPCPMSLQYIGFQPWDPTPWDTQELIERMMPVYRSMAAKNYQAYRRETELHGPRISRPDQPLPESQSLRQPGRMG